MKFKFTFITGIITLFFSCWLFANNFSENLLDFGFKSPSALTCPLQLLPFIEKFNSNSPTADCWTILDENKDATSTTANNIWKYSATAPQEGDRAMTFSGVGLTAVHNDWLISPSIRMNGGIYAITYHYKTSAFNDNEFEVLLSKNGTNPSDFTWVLESSSKRNSVAYVKKVLYVKNITGDINIAWHIVAKGTASLSVDFVTVEQVSCMAPDDNITISKLKKDEVTIQWTDNTYSLWEYFVLPMGSGIPPIGSGLLSKLTTVNVLKTTNGGGVNLIPNTWYEFYVRSKCSNSSGDHSFWVGPIRFKTPCDTGVLPFWEGFNSTSKTLDCWSIIDNNKDAIATTGPNIFYPYNFGTYEGDRAMYFLGNSLTTKNDDWLISPTFTFDPNKFYRLRYHYKTNATYKTDFELVLSNNGTALNDFSKVLSIKKQHSSDLWQEETIIIGKIGGDINLAWHITSDKGYAALYLDNVFLEEIKGCAEPLNLDVKDEKVNEVTLVWEDQFGSNWEYVLQKSGGKTPNGIGTATNTKENTVSKDFLGKHLESNTEYEYYVRTVCGNGDFSIWSGPFVFRTACEVFSMPFWEGFNSDSKLLSCWTIVDENKDATAPTISNIWHSNNIGAYEGNAAMYFYGNSLDNAKLPHNDWLISPRIKMDSKKIYRLKYHFKVAAVLNMDYEFEVLLSNSGLDNKQFTKSVVAKKKYNPSIEWQQEYVFISGVSGDVNLAWHVTSPTKGVYLTVDNVFVEEVFGCPEPIKLTAKNIETKKATVSWTDDFMANSWEYYIQEEGKGIPKGTGTATVLKENTVSVEQSGKILEANTDYEFYVRTICGDGSYSIWSGPFKFVTSCTAYKAPFWEGFNTTSKSMRCWTLLDKSGIEVPQGTNWKTNSNAYEGNQSMSFYLYDGKKEPFNDWLISPTITLDGGMYVLKYRYKTTTTLTFNNEFEVLLSMTGKEITKFNTSLLSSQNYRVGEYVEEVLFFNGVNGDINIAWHIKSQNTTSSYFFLDDVNLKKVETCPEPYAVKISNQTSNSFDLEWQQLGGVTNWEVLVVDLAGTVNSSVVKSAVVSDNPKTTISGLDASKGYTVYVRAQCTDVKSNSDWSTAVNAGTKIGIEDNCDGALNIPVNASIICDSTASGSLFGITKSTVLLPNCTNAGKLVKDIWFEFTAASKIHLLTLTSLVSISGVSGAPELYAVLYDQPCQSLTANSVLCFSLTSSNNTKVLSNLVVGRKYYLRLGVPETTVSDFVFKLCLTTSATSGLEVSPSGIKYSIEELVKDVFVKSNCDLVTNVKYQNGDGNSKAMSYNTFGYFNKAGSDFPFKEGIVLSTNNVEYVPGPYLGYNDFRGDNNQRWLGDKDINDAIQDAGGGPYQEKRVTQVEFDFIPIKKELKFDYLFASNSYHKLCGEVCNTGALFAAWLVDSTTGEGQNLAKISGTNTPIAINTVKDAAKSGITCGSSHPESFWKYYDHFDSPIEAAIDFVGLTTAMSSDMIEVIPGRKYHIKLAVIDFCTTTSHTSAVFFNAGSFDLGELDLGVDMLVDSGNALCDGESKILNSGLGSEDITIQWYRNGTLIPDANQADLEVKESGEYKVVGKYESINCEVMGTIKVEVYPPISSVIQAPVNLKVCRNALGSIKFDLTEVESGMLINQDGSNYQFIYYKSRADAEASINAITDPKNYQITVSETEEILYINVKDIHTTCSEIFSWIIEPIAGSIPTKRENEVVCASYAFPKLESDQFYYSGTARSGISYKAGDVLNIPGLYTIYVFQDNGGGCYEEISYRVTVTAVVEAVVLENVNYECQLYTLVSLPKYNKYFTQSGGQGLELAAGSVVRKAQTVYIYASSDDGLCTDEHSFEVSYTDCPIQKGISPNDDGLNDRFDLSQHGVTSMKIYNRYGVEVYVFEGEYIAQWYGQGKADKLLPDGTYYYVVIAHGKTKTGWVQINR
ncbi:choice-of-anchor J domain-containing protein [Flavobacterium sp. HSC-61S13]|uniref:choice-of-anchor J domain-containing protein n=1 Tax=Flavobacterium sp. HSC-61S13 TaxID=2910963 RepID=UPI00209DE58A|nr:choice-of-anchor J domain-containing protein [Flavobacterium sp. HSC-61S13]MCP1994603.1 gliding motility-associated-like protein [Flavobacterium sp. HSC-61S13]